MGEILYTLSRGMTGELVTANDATKSDRFFCINCNNEMILRKSERGRRRPHFAHKALVTNCTSESALHFGFKELLYHKLRDTLLKSSEFPIQWHCTHCNDIHSSNLIKKTKEVKQEYSFGVCRPDISLLDENGKLIIAIEIVVRHEPEESVLQFYRENKVALIKFNLKSESDINLLEQDVLSPNLVDVCINPKCKKCGNNKLKKYLYMIDGVCWKCKANMKVAAMIIKDNHYSAGEFTKTEIEIALKYGANIQNRYSKTAGTSYNAHVCKECNSFLGEHFIFTEYIAPALYDQIDYDAFELGYNCATCED